MQRNPQNPIKAVKKFEKFGRTQDNPLNALNNRHLSEILHCQACKTEVLPKQGFRISSMKCPKCGLSLVKK